MATAASLRAACPLLLLLLAVCWLGVAQAAVGDSITADMRTELGDTVTVEQVCQRCNKGHSMVVTRRVVGTISQVRQPGSRSNFPSTAYWQTYAKRHDAWQGEDQKGHILASRLGGPAVEWNYAPQLAAVNQPGLKEIIHRDSNWFNGESWAAEKIGAGNKVTVDLRLEYREGCRPHSWSWQGYAFAAGREDAGQGYCTGALRNSGGFHPRHSGPLPWEACDAHFTPRMLANYRARMARSSAGHAAFVRACEGRA